MYRVPCCIAAVATFATACAPAGVVPVARPPVTVVTDTLVPVRDFEEAIARHGWVDSSTHRSGFVANGTTRLHYLDWGGRGAALVLLAGLTNTAHLYDAIAPRLAAAHRVVGITRRGHGQSDHPPTGYALDTLVEDIRAVMDSLRIDRATLVGFSLGGAEITAFTFKYPHRVSGLVYLEGNLGRLPVSIVSGDPIPDPAPPPGLANSVSVAREWLSTYLHHGGWSNAAEANLRAGWLSPAGDVHLPVAAPVVAAILSGVRSYEPDYLQLPVPALGMYSGIGTHPRVHTVSDSSTIARAREFVAERYVPLRSAQKRIFSRMPSGRFVEIGDGYEHYVIARYPGFVAQQILAFSAGLHQR